MNLTISQKSILAIQMLLFIALLAMLMSRDKVQQTVEDIILSPIYKHEPRQVVGQETNGQTETLTLVHTLAMTPSTEEEQLHETMDNELKRNTPPTKEQYHQWRVRLTTITEEIDTLLLTMEKKEKPS